MPIKDLSIEKLAILQKREDCENLKELYKALDTLKNQKQWQVDFVFTQAGRSKAKAKKIVQYGLIELIQAIFDIQPKE